MKNTSISERIKALIETFAGGNNSKFAAMVGTSEANIRNYIAGRQPKFDFLSAIAQRFDINYDWLLTGRGEMNASNPVSGVTYGISEEIPCNTVREPAAPYSRTDTVSVPGNLLNIPIVDITVAAGNGIYNDDNIEVVDYIQLPRTMIKKGHIYLCTRIKGESMAPTLLDSSYLIIRLLDRSEWGYMPEEQIFVVADRSGKAYVKRIKNRLSKGFIVCMSDNPDKAFYPNFNLQEDEINTIWYAEWYISAKMPNIHQTYYTKVSQLEDDIADIKNQLSKMNRQLKR